MPDENKVTVLLRAIVLDDGAIQLQYTPALLAIPKNEIIAVLQEAETIIGQAVATMKDDACPTFTPAQ